MNLYTITIEYDVRDSDLSDTLIEQVHADNPDEAIQKWAENMDLASYPDVGRRIKERLIEDLKNPDNRCVKVSERINMWCTSSLVRGKLFLFHLIRTDSGEKDDER